MRRFFKENSLSIVMLWLFAICLVGQVIAGYRDQNDDRQDHGRPALAVSEYLRSGAFIESVFENWESEFLQMSSYVLLTVFLRQKGSPESKKIDGSEPVDEDPTTSRDNPNAPWPVRRGGLILTLYKNSLSLALLALFFLSVVFHAYGGAMEYNDEQREHAGETISVMEFVGTSRFWFESFQNWQSEFLSVGMLVLLGVYLRQQGSPESKPVASPHSETGH